MKGNRTAIYFISAAVIIAALLTAVMIIRSQFGVYMIINNEGYAVSRNDITKNLLNDAITSEEAVIEAVSFSLSDILYERAGTLFIGEKKAPVNEAYPLFINDTSAIMTLNSEASIVTEDFEFTQSYKGLYISDGISFNQDMERAYREEFILLSMTNGLFINTKEIKAEDNFFVEETIPVNSVVRFMENEIRYYSLKSGMYVFTSVEPLGNGTTLTIDGDSWRYYDFLEKLGLYEKEKLREQETVKPKDDTEPEPEYIPEPEGTNESEPAEKPKEEQPGGTQRERDGQVSRDGTVMPPDRRPDEDEQDDTRQEPPEVPSIPPKPAEPAKPADLPDPVKPSAAAPGGSSYAPEPEPDTKPEVPEKPGGNPLWEKPAVKLGSFTTTVYSIRSAGMVVNNALYLYKSGISFEVYDGSRLVLRKAYNDSANVYIAPLTPDKEYRVVVNMAYLDKYNKRQEEKVTEATVRTKPFDELEPLSLNWSNGDISFDKLRLKDLTIANAFDGPAPAPGSEANMPAYEQYIETVQYLSRVEVVFESRLSSMKAYNFAMTGKDLNEFKAGRPILYETMTRVESNSEYEYGFILYDRFGNTLPLDGIVRGASHTCKMPPKAQIAIVKNEVRNIELDIQFENKDAADITENSLCFEVFDRNGDAVGSTIVRKGQDGTYSSLEETSLEHPIGIDGGTIRFLDLLDHEVYTVRVFCGYNINDGLGNYEDVVIGESNFTTVPLSVLGYAFFDVSVDKLTDGSAEVRVKFNGVRTDSRLVALIDELDVSFAEDETKDGSGIGVTYAIDLKEPDGLVYSGPETGGRIILGPEDTQKLKTAEDGSAVFNIDNLKSNTKYSIVIKPRVIMGNSTNVIKRDIAAFYEPAAFTTLKKTPVIDIDAIYASTDFIKLYGVSVNDPDTAVEAYPVTIVVYDENSIQIASYELSSADKVSVISLNKLVKEKTYTIRFIASEFNNGHDRSTLRKNVELFYSKLASEKESLKITTRDAISGSIQLLQLDHDRIDAAKNVGVGDISSNNSRVRVSSNGRRFNYSSQVTACKFTTKVDFGEGGWNGFQLGYSDGRYNSSVFTSTVFKLYLTDPGTNPGAQPIATITAGETLGTEYCRWTDQLLLDSLPKLTGERTIYLTAEKTGTNDGGIDCLWGMRFHKVQRSGDENFYADLNVNINDVNGELGTTPSYMIKIYKNNAWIDTRRHKWVNNGNGTYTLNMYQVAPDGRETLVDSKIYEGTANVCNTDFYYPVDSGFNTYRYDLWVNIFDYEMNLSTEEFTAEKEITAIRTEEDLRNVRFGVTKKYIVLNDIETTYNNNNINASQHFLGELDFRGHTLTYNSTSALITYLGYSGVLKNMNLRYGDGWGETVERRSIYLVTYNYGTISNVMITRNNGNVVNTHRTGMSGLCHTNYEGGLIENFVINLKDPFIGSNSIAGACVTNRGIIRNGYVYGQPLQRTDRSILTEVQNTETLYMGGVVRINQPGGTVENVYSSIDINTREVQTSSDCANLVVARNEGRVRNSFSTGNVYYNGEIRKDMGPATRNIYSGAVRDIYYYSEHDYGNTDNTKVPLEILYDLEWYRRLFNSNEATMPGQFDLEPVKMGYYPHVVWPDCMPQQEFVPLPAILPRDMVDILDANVTEQLDNSAIAVITFKNPQDLQIREIKIRWLSTEIISQDRVGDFYRVTVRLTQPEDTKYYSSYPVLSFVYALGFKDLTSKVEYEEGKEPVIPAEFYKPIITLTDWASMKDDLIQNYRLEADLDFLGVSADVAVIPANVTLAVSNAAFKNDAFAGKLNGKGHSIRNINTADYGYIFGKLTGSIKNLTAENITSAGDGRYKGLIGRMLEESSVDNVHIFRFNADSIEHCGAIAGDARNAYIINSSAHDLVIRTVADGAYTQYVGGLVGKQRMDSTTILANISIMNCYVDTFSIDVLKAGDCGGIGGIVGFIRAGTEISHVYAVNGAINTVFRNVGGIIGTVDNRVSNATSYKLKDFYVDVDITTVTDRAGGVIGYAGTTNAMDKNNTSDSGDEEDQEPVKPGCHGLVLGNVSTTKTDAAEVGYYFGYKEAEPVGIYRYENALLNGRLNTDTASEEVLTFGELASPDMYEPGGQLDWDRDFYRNQKDPAYISAIMEGTLPKLMDIKLQALLPYQRDFSIKPSLISVTNIVCGPYSNLYEIQITTEHAPEITVTGAKFNGLKTAVLDESDEPERILRAQDGKSTVLQYIVDLDGYYDAYYLTELLFTISGEDGNKSQLMHLNVGIEPQYLEIGSVDRWNELMAVNQFGQKGFNIRITGNLDFTSIFGNAVKNVVVNHITGSDITEAGRKKIRGITLNGNESLIQTVNGNISYLDFEDITLTKTKQDNPENINSLGIISQVIGDMHHMGFRRIKIEAYNSFYAGIVALAYSRNSDIALEDITVIGTYGTLPAKRAVGGLIGKLSGAGSVERAAAEDIIVIGRGYTGGIVGTQEDGRSLWGIDASNIVVSGQYTSSDSYVGGIIGYANTNVFTDRIGNISIDLAVVHGHSYVGGIVGMGNAPGDNEMTAGEKDSYRSQASRIFAAGSGALAGGITGAGMVQRADLRGSFVYSTNRIGGITGNGDTYFATCTDSVIGSVYDRDPDVTGNLRFRSTVADRREYYVDLSAGTEDASKKAVYDKAAEVIGNLVTAGRNNSWSTTTFNNTNYSIGGIAGYALSMHNSIASNCRIGSFGATDVGGISGRAAVSSYNYGPYRHVSSGSQNCYIYGASNVGGITGNYMRGYMDSCYSNSTVEASVTNAGGIAGYVKSASVSNLNETPRAVHVYFTGTVTAPAYAAGIFGNLDQPLYGTNEGWLMGGTVTVTGMSSWGDFYLNKLSSDKAKVTRSVVYEGSSVGFQDGVSQKPSDFHDINIVTSADLKDKTTYIDDMGYSSDEGILSTNYSTRYWKYSGLSNNYMPYLTHAPYNNYNMSESIRILKNQEGYLLDEVTGKAKVDANGLYVYKYETFDGGIPIPGSGAGVVSRMSLMRSPDEIPGASFYAVDADKLNMEFSYTHPGASFRVYADGRLIMENPVSQRAFTLNYDFRSELKVSVTDGKREESYEIWPEDVSRNIMTWGNDYYYITLDGAAGSKGILYGNFVNLYQGRALDASGEVYDLESGQILRKFNGIGPAENVVPLYSFEYEDYKLETYKNYSVVNGVIRDQLRLFVKDNELSAVSAKLAMVHDSIILDSYGNKAYKTALFNDGTITDMTDCPITMPRDFDNKDISYMTTNLGSTSHVLLVRYDDGAVAGFDYTTGERLDIASPRGTRTQLTDPEGISLRSQRVSMANFDTAYKDALEFGKHLLESGWAQLNGDSISGGEAVSGDDGKVSQGGAGKSDGGASASPGQSGIADNNGAAQPEGSTNPAGDSKGISNADAGAAGGSTDSGTAGSGTGIGAAGNNQNSGTTGDNPNTGTPGDNPAAGAPGNNTNTDEKIKGSNTGTASDSPDTAASGSNPDSGKSMEDTVDQLTVTTEDASGAAASGEAPAAVDTSDIDVSGNNGDGSGAGNMQADTDEADREAEAPGGKTGEPSAQGEKAEEVSVTGQKAGKSAASAIRAKAGKGEKPRYIPVYDVQSSQYVLFDEKELLTLEDEKLEPMNDKVKRAGHMIEYRPKHRADIKDPRDGSIYGYLLLSAAIAGIALLLGFMILKKQKEAV